MMVFEYAVVEEELLVPGDWEADWVVELFVEGTTHQFVVMSMEGRVVGTEVGLQRDAEVEDMVGFCVAVIWFRLGFS
jgi:hypothetical protein